MVIHRREAEAALLAVVTMFTSESTNSSRPSEKETSPKSNLRNIYQLAERLVILIIYSYYFWNMCVWFWEVNRSVTAISCKDLDVHSRPNMKLAWWCSSWTITFCKSGRRQPIRIVRDRNHNSYGGNNWMTQINLEFHAIYLMLKSFAAKLYPSKLQSRRKPGIKYGKGQPSVKISNLP